MAGEVFGQFVPGPFVRGDNASHDPGSFQHGQVAVDRAGGQVGAMLENFGDGERVGLISQELHQFASVDRVSLTVRAQPSRRDEIEVLPSHWRRWYPRTRPEGHSCNKFENQYHYQMPLRRVAIAATALVAGALVVTGCGSRGTQATAAGVNGRRPLVVTTTSVLADFARTLTGPEVDVRDLTAAGSDPHDYQPTAGDLHAMEKALVIVINGIGIEPWFGRAQAATSPSATTVTASDGVTVVEDDPHIWLDPANATVMIDNMAPALAAALPEQAAAIRARQMSLRVQFAQLDTEIRTRLATVTDRRLVTNHDAFGYFARRYGLEVVGSVIPTFDTSAELSTSDVRKLVATIKAEQIQTIFSEARVPSKSAQAIATETGVRIFAEEDGLFGDGLGPRNTPTGTYLGMMRHNADVIARGLAPHG
jgi:zinc/manganese transport system substrate-binding protein